MLNCGALNEPDLLYKRVIRHFLVFGLLTFLAACIGSEAPGSGVESRILTLGDGTDIAHPWDEAGPLPASNDWVNVEVAGYMLAEHGQGDGFTWTWTFTLAVTNPDVDMVVVSDVSDADALRLVTPDDGIFNKGKWLAQSDSMPVSGFHLPWLFKDGESIRILRFSIADRQGQTRILYQPVLFTHEGKKSLIAIARAGAIATSGT